MKKKATNNKPAKARKKPVKKKPVPRSNHGLTKKQEDFCHDYLETGNASEAYRRSYNCGRMKPETIHRNAHALLHNTKIATRIRELQDERKMVSDIKKERVMYEVNAIMDAKVSDYFTYKDENLEFVGFDKLTERQNRAIESLKQTKDGWQITLHWKSWSTDRICKMLGYEAPRKVDHTTKGDKIEPGSDTIIILPSNARD